MRAQLLSGPRLLFETDAPAKGCKGRILARSKTQRAELFRCVAAATAMPRRHPPPALTSAEV
jgi:hypothetical protein